MMVVVMSTAAFSVMMVVLMLVIMSAAALSVVVMMMFVLFMIMSAAALSVVVVMMFVLFMIMSAAALSVMVMMLMLFLKHLLLQGYRMLHNLYQFLTVKILNRSRDDSSILIQATEKLQRLLNLFLTCNIGTAHDDGTCILDLVIKELTEVLHIHFAFFCINNSCIAVQFNVNLVLNTLYSLDNVRKLTNS